jgi:Kef-type K+ transport system membrane component KefB
MPILAASQEKIKVALIVALVGLQSKILSFSAYGIIVLMTIVTTLVAPPALRYLFHVESKPVPNQAASPTLEL